jgi:hypothetical protein
MRSKRMYSSGYTPSTNSNMQLWEFYQITSADVLEKLTQSKL